MLISYNQNFVVKKSAGRRGARLIGTEHVRVVCRHFHIKGPRQFSYPAAYLAQPYYAEDMAAQLMEAPGRERPSSPAFSTEEEKASGTKGNALFQVHAIHGTFWKNGGAH